MKVENSSIVFASSHEESSYKFKESVSMDVAASKGAVVAILDLSKEAKGMSMKDAMLSYQSLEKENLKKQRQDSEERNLSQLARMLKLNKEKNQFEISDELDMKIRMIKEILAALQGKRISKNAIERLQNERNNSKLAVAASSLAANSSLITGASLMIDSNPSNLNGINTNAWQKITATTGFYSEQESTTFSSTGKVVTKDGRTIDFNLEVGMSRAFMAEINSLEVKDYIKMDPLVINLDSNIASVSDQKFFFDLDSDGEKESISSLGKDSGFLAFDKNNDGIINNGSELFGTKSGDGFKDLAAYDEDNNGWIDENDSIFNKLKVWTRDEDGNDLLIDLKAADVGAIYLDNADTKFSLKDENMNLNGQIMKTGIYLKESTGMVGTINHLDLVL